MRDLKPSQEWLLMPNTGGPSARAWVAGMLASTVAAMLCAGAACQTAYEAFQGYIPSRSAGGLVSIMGGLLGPLIPLVLAVKRKRFVSLSHAIQWLIVVTFPVALLSLCTLSWHLSRDSGNPVLPLLRYPTLTVSLLSNNDAPYFSFEPDQASGGAGGTQGNSSSEFGYTAWVTPSAREALIRITGTMRRPRQGAIEISMDLYVKERLRFQISGISDVKFSRIPESFAESVVFEHGVYKVVIEGSPDRS